MKIWAKYLATLLVVSSLVSFYSVRRFTATRNTSTIRVDRSLNVHPTVSGSTMLKLRGFMERKLETIEAEQRTAEHNPELTVLKRQGLLSRSKRHYKVLLNEILRKVTTNSVDGNDQDNRSDISGSPQNAAENRPTDRKLRVEMSSMRQMQTIIKKAADRTLDKKSLIRPETDGRLLPSIVGNQSLSFGKHNKAMLIDPRNKGYLRKYLKKQLGEKAEKPSCRDLVTGSKVAQDKARVYQILNPKKVTTEYEYLKMVEKCDEFIHKRGYFQKPLSKEEADFPIAFVMATYRDFEMAERLLRLIYMPQNLYCIHIDAAAPYIHHKAWQRIARCFPNVFIASKLAQVKWGEMSVIYAYLNCMRDLIGRYRGKWKYLINLTGQEIPLKTNYQIVKILKAFNGTNHVTGEVL